MRRSHWHLIFLAFLGLVLVGCQGFLGTETSDERLRPGDKVVSVDRIVYVGIGGDLFTVKADGTDPQQLTGNNQIRSEPEDPEARQIPAAFLGQTLNLSQFYAWPTWSPDGAKLAVSRVQLQREGRLRFRSRS